MTYECKLKASVTYTIRVEVPNGTTPLEARKMIDDTLAGSMEAIDAVTTDDFGVVEEGPYFHDDPVATARPADFTLAGLKNGESR